MNQPTRCSNKVQVYCLSFRYRSTCFGHHYAHQQEPINCRPAQPRPTALLPPRSYGKLEAAAAVDRLLMMGIRMPETCWAVSKRQTLNL